MRCDWVPEGDPQYVDYHDNEWGRPAIDAQAIFEKVCLEGFQSGLSWLTILRKRDRFREVFNDFEFRKVANFGPEKVDELLLDSGIVRHRGKIEAVINNAQRAIELDESVGIVDWFWEWSERNPRDTWPVPAKTDSSAKMAKELKSRGWKFFGPTTAYAFMQSEGLVNDHHPACISFVSCEKQRQDYFATLS